VFTGSLVAQPVHACSLDSSVSDNGAVQPFPIGHNLQPLPLTEYPRLARWRRIRSPTITVGPADDPLKTAAKAEWRLVGLIPFAKVVETGRFPAPRTASSADVLIAIAELDQVGECACPYQPTLERLSVGVRSPPESRPSDRAIQQVGDQCLVPATKRTLDVTRVYARL